jgi:hypothetical protein
MTLSDADYLLIDSSNGVSLGADTTVIVPEVFGGFGYDILYDPDAAAEYAEQQGIRLDPPAAALALSNLSAEPRPYLAIDLETGVTAAPEDLRLLAVSGDEADELLEGPTADLKARALAEGLVPSVDADAIRAAEGLPFESTVG